MAGDVEEDEVAERALVPYRPLLLPHSAHAELVVPRVETLLYRLSREVAVNSLASLTLSSTRGLQGCLTQLGVLKLLSIRAAGLAASEVC